MSKLAGSILVALLVLVPSLGLAQGLYWETKTTGAGKGEQTAKVYATPQAMKIVGDGNQVMILQADQEKMIALDTKKKTYWETSFGELESQVKSMESQMDAAMKQMEGRLKDLPPEQQEAVRKMMPKPKGAPEAPVEVKGTGKSKAIGGHECKEFVATQDGKPVLTAWTTEDLTAFGPVRKNWLAMQKRLAGTSRSFGGGVAEAYTKVEGFPMETEMGQVKTVVTKVEERAIPATEFEVPSDYKKSPPPGAQSHPGN
jgi:hypothetical protein